METALQIRETHPGFVAEIGGLELRHVRETATFDAIRAAMDAYAVCIFRDQIFEDDEQIAFARRFDGEINTSNGRGAVEGEIRRIPAKEITDISNLNERGEIFDPSDGRRVQGLANRLWHTDTAFTNPPGRYSMLHARGGLPPKGGETEYADMRAAYDSLSPELKDEIADLQAHHSIVYSRESIGFTGFTPAQRSALPGAGQPMVRTNPRTGRKSLYVASHASHILGRPVPEGRLLLRELIALATYPQFVHRHMWRKGDLVIWDNLATMHRGLAFDESYARDLRRVTTLDIERVPASR